MDEFLNNEIHSLVMIQVDTTDLHKEDLISTAVVTVGTIGLCDDF